MMAVNVKLVDATMIDTSRCEAKLDRRLAEIRLNADLLSAASKDVEGERQWFALRIGQRSETELRDSLIDSRVDAVVPVKNVPRKRRFKVESRKVVHKPVLPKLVFVNIVPSVRAYAGLLRVKGVSAFIGTNGSPHPIGHREMNGFMHLAQEGAFDERNMPRGIVVGSRVRINVGPYAEFEGVVSGYAKGRAARVLTYLFGREVTVDVTLAQLEELG